MRDAERRLLRCIGGIDDELILEAATARFRARRWGHLIALAACLALVLTIPVFLNQSKPGPEAAPGYEYLTSPESGNTLAGTEDPELEGGSYDLSIGGIKPGMTEEEVISILGEPMDQENGWINYNGISIEISRFLPQVITIDLRNGSLTLPTGIGPGSTEEELLNTYPGLEQNDDHEGVTIYTLEQPDQRMTVSVRNSQVDRVIVEHLGDLMLDALTVNEITIYQWNGKIWDTTTVIDKAAKYICTVLTISEPEEATGEKDGVSMWMDFGNGTAVELLGGDRASVWTYTGDTFDPDKTDGLTYQIGGVFQDLDKYVSEALADPTATWEQDAWDNIIHEGDPESAPEAEP